MQRVGREGGNTQKADDASEAQQEADPRRSEKRMRNLGPAHIL